MPEDGKVMAFRDLDNQRLGGSLTREILSQLLPKQTGVRAHDAVFAAVIAWRPLKNMHTDLLFGGGFGGLFQSAICDIEQKFTQTQRTAELGAGNHALDQHQPGVT